MTDYPERFPELFHLPCCHEPFSALSHLGGAVLFAFLGALLLLRGRGSGARLAFLGVYAAACVFMFSMSALFHMMVRGGTAHRVFERLDHGAIFFLVAGTFTPAHGLLFRGWLRWGPLLLIWTAAVTGITLKTIYFDVWHEAVGLAFYLGLGWLGLASTMLLARLHGFAFVKPLLLGGIVYTCGGVMEFVGWWTVVPGIVHPHELWHLAVLVGAFLHWQFIWQFAAGNLGRTAAIPGATHFETRMQ
jgi:channel protein (hemolysin III family)